MNRIKLNDDLIALAVRDIVKTNQHSGQLTVQVGIANLPRTISWQLSGPNSVIIQSGDGGETVYFAEHNGVYYLHGYGRTWQAKVDNPLLSSGGGAGADGNSAVAPMPGTIVSLNVNEGDAVTKGTLLLTIESMKMLTDITAERDGTIKEIHLAVGDTFDKGVVLISLE